MLYAFLYFYRTATQMAVMRRPSSSGQALNRVRGPLRKFQMLGDTALVGFNPPLWALHLVYSGLSLLYCETLRLYVWTVVVVTLVCFCRSKTSF